MSETPPRESPLVQCDVAAQSRFQEAPVMLAERPFLGHVNLRGDPADSAFVQAVEAVLELALPVQPNTVSEDKDRIAFWLGPDEWLLMTPPDGETELIHALRKSLAGLFAAVTDVTGGQTIITVKGSFARDLLAKGCPLDLHPRVFGPGRCAQTHIAKTAALIRPQDGQPPVFEIIVRRSFADYLWRWLEDGAVEYRS